MGRLGVESRVQLEEKTLANGTIKVPIRHSLSRDELFAGVRKEVDDAIDNGQDIVIPSQNGPVTFSSEDLLASAPVDAHGIEQFQTVVYSIVGALDRSQEQLGSTAMYRFTPRRSDSTNPR